MDPWPFVAAAYGLTLLATAAVSLWSWNAAHRAERRARQSKDRR